MQERTELLDALGEAEKAFIRSLAAREALPEGGAEGAFKNQELAQTHTSLGNLYRLMSQLQPGAAHKAESHLQQALENYSLGFFSGHMKTAHARLGLYELCKSQGRLAEGLGWLAGLPKEYAQLERWQGEAQAIRITCAVLIQRWARMLLRRTLTNASAVTIQRWARQTRLRKLKRWREAG